MAKTNRTSGAGRDRVANSGDSTLVVTSKGRAIDASLYTRLFRETATKATESRLLTQADDPMFKALGEIIVRPRFDRSTLVELLNLNVYHMRCVRTKAVDVVASGWKLVEAEGVEDDPDVERLERVRMFLENPHPQMTLEEVLLCAWADFEALGDLYLELTRVERTASTDTPLGEPGGLNHVPAHTLFVHKELDRFVQKRGKKKVFFKMVDDSRFLDSDTGEFRSNGGDPSRDASEIINVRNYSPTSDAYGAPDIIPALGAIVSDRSRASFVMSFFENYGVPRYAVTIIGADLTPEIIDQIEQFFDEQVKGGAHGTLMLSVGGKTKTAEGEVALDASNVKVEWTRLDTDVHEASFRLLRRDNRDEILSAHGVPPYRAGIAETGSLGGTTAAESTEVYKQSIVEPRQRILEARINRHVLWNGFGATDIAFEFERIDTRDLVREVDMVVARVAAGIMTPNEAIRELGGDDVDGDAMNWYYRDGVPFAMGDGTPIEQEEREVVQNALREMANEMIALVKRHERSPSLVVDNELLDLPT